MAAAMAAARLLLVLAACLTAAPRGADAFRWLGVGVGGAKAAHGDAAINLDASNFTAFLQASREPFAVVEFYANWSPACRKYKPHYEKVAKLFNGPDAAHPGTIVMARVDCSLRPQVNVDLCNKFSVDHYPYLVGGLPTKFNLTQWKPKPKFNLAQWKPKQENSELELIYDGTTADRLLKWINKKMGSSFNLDDKKHENKSMLAKMLQIVNRLFEQFMMLRKLHLMNMNYR